MTRGLAALLIITLTGPLLAQDLPDVITHPIAIPTRPAAPDLTPLWLAIQQLAERQATLETQLTPLVGLDVTTNSRITALDARVVVLESKPAGPSALAAFFNGVAAILTSEYFWAGAGIVIGHFLVPAK